MFVSVKLLLMIVNLQTSVFYSRQVESHLRSFSLHRILYSVLARSRTLHSSHFSCFLEGNRILIRPSHSFHPPKRSPRPGINRSIHVPSHLLLSSSPKSHSSRLCKLEWMWLDHPTCTISFAYIILT